MRTKLGNAPECDTDFEGHEVSTCFSFIFISTANKMNSNLLIIGDICECSRTYILNGLFNQKDFRLSNSVVFKILAYPSYINNIRNMIQYLMKLGKRKMQQKGFLKILNGRFFIHWVVRISLFGKGASSFFSLVSLTCEITKLLKIQAKYENLIIDCGSSMY